MDSCLRRNDPSSPNDCDMVTDEEINEYYEKIFGKKPEEESE
jgi:hypothetical protein